MINFNQNSFGQKLRVNFGQDISTATLLEMKIEPESGDEIDKTPTLGTADVEVGDETFEADQYVEYETEEGDFEDYTGRYRVKAIATLPTETISTDYVLFRVMP